MNDVMQGWARRQVTMDLEGRTLLGDVLYSYSDDSGETRLRVRHFCGDPWPLDPRAADVTVLE